MITALAVVATLASGIVAPRSAPLPAPSSAPAPTGTDRITDARALTSFLANVRRTPSFARQMKLACNTCHLGGFPQLTRFGRLFKLNGYTLSGLPQIVEQLDTLSRRTLSLSPIPGLSMAVMVDITQTGKALPGTMRTTADYPQQASLFYAGEIATKLGALVELNFSGATGRIGFDNSDVRFASHTKFTNRDVLYGITLHNNPTVQDVWNTASAWSYPFVSSQTVPRPVGAPVLDGGLAQSVLGLGAYALFNNMLYTEVSGYTSAPQGARAAGDTAAPNTMRNVAPYWRVALQNRNGPMYLMVGAFGLATDLYPGGITGETNHYEDVGVDAQAEREVGRGMLVVRASWIHEKQGLAAAFTSTPAQSDNLTNSLDSYRANAAWSPNKYYTLTVGAFGTTGSHDARLYAPAAVTGSRTGTPDSQGGIGEITVSPWLNARVGLQYVMYRTFNGASHAYDVSTSGRNARDNNTLMLYTWFAF